jgi:hypothetical protein
MEKEPIKEIEQTIKFDVKTNNLTNVIKLGIDADIATALSLYCRDEQRLSIVYWPKAFRSLLTYILEALLNKPEIWAELSTASVTIDREELQRLIDGLKTLSVY